MSSRHLLYETGFRDEHGMLVNGVMLFRDCDTHTYRLFVQQTGEANIDFTFDDLQKFSDALNRAITKHELWIDE